MLFWDMVGLTFVRGDAPCAGTGDCGDSAFAATGRFGEVFSKLRAGYVALVGAAFGSAGLVQKELDTLNHYPAYLMFSPTLFRLGVLYERLTSLRIFRGLRGSIVCVFEKPMSPAKAAANVNAGGEARRVVRAV